MQLSNELLYICVGMKKNYTSRLNFDKASDEKVSLKLNYAGVVMPSQMYEGDINNVKVLEHFGFFGSGGDPNKFYPDIKTAKDIIPKEEDFVKVPFRMLSATTVGSGTWKATEFPEEVLKASMMKLLNKPVFTEHTQEVDNWVGIVVEVKWSPARTVNGEFIPAGIDGVIAIDAKSNPKIARGVLIGAIFSNSVSVVFDWVMSHSFESNHDFMNEIGNIHKDGKMVRRVATVIHDYYEDSLCWLGADPYAKAIDAQGNLVNVDTSNVYNEEKSYGKELEGVKAIYEKNKKFEINYCLDKKVLSLSKGEANPIPNKENNMKDFIAKMAALFNITEAQVRKTLNLSAEGEIDEAAFKTAFVQLLTAENKPDESLALKGTILDKVMGLASFKAVVGDNVELKDLAISEDTILLVKPADYTELKTKADSVATLEADKKTAEDKVTELTPNATLGEQFVAGKRKEAVNLYKKMVGAKQDAAVIALMEKATNTELDGLLAQYTQGATAKFSGSCKKCGSGEFEFRSTIAGKNTTEDFTTVEAGTPDALREKFGKSSMSIGSKN